MARGTAMSQFFDDLARTLATSMPRQRQSRVLGGALVSIAVPGIAAKKARAASSFHTCKQDGGRLLCECNCKGNICQRICCTPERNTNATAGRWRKAPGARRSRAACLARRIPSAARTMSSARTHSRSSAARSVSGDAGRSAATRTRNADSEVRHRVAEGLHEALPARPSVVRRTSAVPRSGMHERSDGPLQALSEEPGGVRQQVLRPPDEPLLRQDVLSQGAVVLRERQAGGRCPPRQTCASRSFPETSGSSRKTEAICCPNERLNQSPKLCCPPGQVGLNSPGFRTPPPGVSPFCCPRGQICSSGSGRFCADFRSRPAELRWLRKRVRIGHLLGEECVRCHDRRRRRRPGPARSRLRRRRSGQARRPCGHPPSRRGVRHAGEGRRSGGAPAAAGRASVAGLLLPAPTAAAAVVAALALLAVFTGAVAVSLLRGRAPDCHLFRAAPLRAGELEALVRNAGLAAVGVIALVGSIAEPRASATAWIGNRAGGARCAGRGRRGRRAARHRVVRIRHGDAVLRAPARPARSARGSADRSRYRRRRAREGAATRP